MYLRIDITDTTTEHRSGDEHDTQREKEHTPKGHQQTPQRQRPHPPQGTQMLAGTAQKHHRTNPHVGSYSTTDNIHTATQDHVSVALTAAAASSSGCAETLPQLASNCCCCCGLTTQGPINNHHRYPTKQPTNQAGVLEPASSQQPEHAVLTDTADRHG